MDALTGRSDNVLSSKGAKVSLELARCTVPVTSPSESLASTQRCRVESLDEDRPDLIGECWLYSRNKSPELEATAATWRFTIVVREGPDGSLLDVSGIAKVVQPKNRSFHQSK